MYIASPKPQPDLAKIQRARSLISNAIDLLDQAGAPAEIAAHLELALHRLNERNRGS